MRFGRIALFTKIVWSCLCATNAFAPKYKTNVSLALRQVTDLKGNTPARFMPSKQRITRDLKEASLQSTPTDDNDNQLPSSALSVAGLATISFFYWYWLVLGAAAKTNGLPFVPDFLPMVPGWPPAPEELQGVYDDSYHFFYLSELLQKTDAPFAPPTRLAVYNIAESWIFAYLPLLWKDSKRLPRPALLGLWASLGIGLTNAFLAPYLLTTALIVNPPDDEPPKEKNQIVSYTMGGIATAVATFALYQVVTVTNAQDWAEFLKECQLDRTYFAFVVDLFLFSLFQPYILKRAEGKNEPIDYVPFVGLMSWLFRK